MAMTPRGKRILVWSAPLAALAGALAWALAPKPVPVDLARAVRGPLTVTVEAEGETRVRDVYVVSAPVAGHMQRLSVEAGDAVQRGEAVAVIRPADPSFLDTRAARAALAEVRAAEAAVAVARAELSEAESELTFARADFERYQELARKGTVSRRVLERAETDFRAARAARTARQQGLDARKAELEAARARLIQPAPEPQGDAAAAPATAETCCVPVPAPADGRVLSTLQESEAVVQAGQPILEIGDPRDLEVKADFLSADAVQVRPGMPVTLVDWGGPPLVGIVRRVEPSGFTKVSALGIEEQRVNVLIDPVPDAPWPDTLGHAFRVLARVAVWHTDDTLAVPMGAVFRTGGQWAVFRVEDGVARRRTVRIGRTNGLTAEVTDGLAVGDTLVLHPSDRVADGTPVEVRTAS